MRFRMGRSGRKHKIGKAHAEAAINSGVEPLVEERVHNGRRGVFLEWEAVKDDRGVELHIIARVADEDPDLAIINHCMPTSFSKKESENG